VIENSCVCQERNETILLIESIQKSIDELCSQLACLAHPSSCATCDDFTNFFIALDDQISALVKLLLAQSITICSKFTTLERSLSEQEEAICRQIISIQNQLGMSIDDILTLFTKTASHNNIKRQHILEAIGKLGATLQIELQCAFSALRSAVLVQTNGISILTNDTKTAVVKSIGEISTQIVKFEHEVIALINILFSYIESATASNLCTWCAVLKDAGTTITKTILEQNDTFELTMSVLHDELVSKLSGLETFLTQKDSHLLAQINKVKESAKTEQLRFGSVFVMANSEINSSILSTFGKMDTDVVCTVDSIRLCLIRLCTALHTDLNNNTLAFATKLVAWLDQFCLKLSCLQSAICDVLAAQFTATELFASNKLDRIKIRVEEMQDGVQVQQAEALGSIDCLGALLEQEVCIKISGLETSQAKDTDQFLQQFGYFQANLVSQLCSKLAAMELVLLGKASDIMNKIVRTQVQLDEKIDDIAGQIISDTIARDDLLCAQVQAAAFGLESQLVVAISNLGVELKSQEHNLCVKVTQESASLQQETNDNVQNSEAALLSYNQMLSTQIMDMGSTVDEAYENFLSNMDVVQNEIIGDIVATGAILDSRLQDITAALGAAYLEYLGVLTTLILNVATNGSAIF